MKNSAEVTLILGGARSGKSDYAEKLAAEAGQCILYIATAEIGDAEMAARVEAHRRARPTSWQTLEAPRDVGQALAQLETKPDVLLLDCMTLLVSNIVLALEEKPESVVNRAITDEIEAIIAAQQRLGTPLFVVSNEVGLGIVPAYSLGRRYRDVLGRANQHWATLANRVLFMVAGLPMTLKDDRENPS